MGRGCAALLGEGAASCAFPCSILPSSTQAQDCRGWGRCGHAECDQALFSSACHRLRALPPLFQSLGAPWHCHAQSGLWLCPAPPARQVSGPGSVEKSQCPVTAAGSSRCWRLEPPGATPSDMVVGEQGGWIGGWGCVADTCTLVDPGQGYPWVGTSLGGSLCVVEG